MMALHIIVNKAVTFAVQGEMCDKSQKIGVLGAVLRVFFYNIQSVFEKFACRGMMQTDTGFDDLIDIKRAVVKENIRPLQTVCIGGLVRSYDGFKTLRNLTGDLGTKAFMCVKCGHMIPSFVICIEDIVCIQYKSLQEKCKLVFCDNSFYRIR